MSGLVKLDTYSFTTTLTKPAGYWLTTVALWPFWIVDSKVIVTAGDNVWFTNPQTLVGSGPFRMTSRSAGQALDFEPVPKWYGGSTGSITHVHIGVVADKTVQISRASVTRDRATADGSGPVHDRSEAAQPAAAHPGGRHLLGRLQHEQRAICRPR